MLYNTTMNTTMNTTNVESKVYVVQCTTNPTYSLVFSLRKEAVKYKQQLLRSKSQLHSSIIRLLVDQEGGYILESRVVA